MRAKRSELIGVRVEPAVKAEVEALAAREHRTISQQVHKILVDALAALKCPARHGDARRAAKRVPV